ncbi:outer membrane beta-barrel protein [Spirosoma arboris]|uniref:outer membrane beta-barrel protein n=1 Tax=Spirosoma arboris TaxID=2682092 RepID=UPI0018DD3C63|nr:outer membrane beta-barrel family protein [Spirosoma arboris]
MTSHSLKGTVIDSLTQRPIEYATVSVQDSAQKTLAITYTNSEGVFTLPIAQAGNYVLFASFVGYGTRRIPCIVQPSVTSQELRPIFLAADVQVLESITVRGQRQLVEQKPGMLVYHAEDDVTNLGGTAADVLRKAPVLSVDADGNVRMRGSQNLKILINGRYSGQMARNPADALNMIPSDIIKSVEVITSPSSRYEAEGAAGVINIITKKSLSQLSGAMEAGFSNLEAVFNPRVAFSTGKWDINAYAHLHRSRVKTESNLTRQSIDGTYQLNQQLIMNNARPHGSGDVSANYEADSSQVISMSAAWWFGNWPASSNQQYQIQQGTQQQAFLQQTQTQGAPNEGLEVSLSYLKRLRKPEQSFFIIGQYNNNFRDDFNYYARQVDLENRLLYQEQNNNHMHTNEWTFQTDYAHPLARDGKKILEIGLKTVLRDVTSGYTTLISSSTDPAQLQISAARTNVFDYSQNVLAAYAQAKWTASGGWFAQAGIRLEETYLNGHFQTTLLPFTNQFTNWVPSATLVKKWRDSNSLTLSYTQRISRPSIIDLNPNIDARDARNLVTGNHDLRPEVMHQGELSYSLSAPSGLFLNTTLFGKQTANSIEDVIQVNTSGVSTTTKQNVAANKQYGMNVSTSFSLLPDWSLGSNARLSYLNFQSRYLGIQSEGWSAGINVNTTYKLAGHYTLQAFGDYDSRAITLQGYQTSWLYYSLAVKKEFPKTKVTIGFSAVNPFQAFASRSDVIIASSFESTTANRYYNRAFKVTLNWKFGEAGNQRSRRGVDNDDVKSSGER